VETVALMSLKGGTGKSSIALHLAAALHTSRRRVAVVDCDPQQSATLWAQSGELPFAVHSLDTGQGVVRFRRELVQLEASTDLAILDCPPELAETAMLAALLSDLLLIPCSPSALDLRAAHAAVELAREARQERDKRLPLVSLVPSKLISRTRLAAELPAVLREMGEPVAPSIYQRVAVAQASVTGRTVPPKSPAGQEFRTLARHVLRRL